MAFSDSVKAHCPEKTLSFSLRSAAKENGEATRAPPLRVICIR